MQPPLIRRISVACETHPASFPSRLHRCQLRRAAHASAVVGNWRNLPTACRDPPCIPYAALIICAIAQIRNYEYVSAMFDPVPLLAALAEPTRLAALRILSDGGEHCVCELTQRLGASPSRMSRHMGALRSAGLVIDRRDAQWVRYRLRPDLAPERRAILDAVMAAMIEPDRSAA
ncbi:ArsR/SmtB family transcription factor [Bradyrhizobium sp. HKCCYLS2038]|uniref:ArsR/SmtB family transcription factor n=1 Tax=unclassified Bradyrhizobium TaxID=2631580 RepID=UPI003EBB19EA